MDLKLFPRTSSELPIEGLRRLGERSSSYQARLELAAALGHRVALAALAQREASAIRTGWEDLSERIPAELESFALVGVVRLTCALLREQGIFTRGPCGLSLLAALGWARRRGATLSLVQWAIAEAAVLHSLEDEGSLGA